MPAPPRVDLETLTFPRTLGARGMGSPTRSSSSCVRHGGQGTPLGCTSSNSHQDSASAEGSLNSYCIATHHTDCTMPVCATDAVTCCCSCCSCCHLGLQLRGVVHPAFAVHADDSIARRYARPASRLTEEPTLAHHTLREISIKCSPSCFVRPINFSEDLCYLSLV